MKKKQNRLKITVVAILMLAAVAGSVVWIWQRKVTADRHSSADRLQDDIDMEKQVAEHDALFAKAEQIEIVIEKGSLNAPSYRLEKGKPYKLSLSTKDAGEHILRIPAFSIATMITAKKGPIVYEVVPSQSGESEIFCSNHKSEKAKLTVK
jgi:hypothetical protein